MLAFYSSVGESVLWNSDDLIAVADWELADELTFHQLAKRAVLRAVGYDVPTDDGLYHVSWTRARRSRRRGFARSTANC